MVDTSAIPVGRADVRVDAVVFDFFGTLTPGTTMAARDAARAAVAAALGIDGDMFADVVRSTFDQRACGSTGDLAETLRWLAQRCAVDVTDAAVAAAYVERLRVEREFMQPRPEALQVLSALRDAGLRIGVLSDCTHELPLLWPTLPYVQFVDAAVFSVEMRMRKPHPQMYQAVCDRLGVRAESCLYVGDGGSNELSGATTAGMFAVHLQGPEFASAHTFDAEPDWSGPVIGELAGVYSYVGDRVPQ